MKDNNTSPDFYQDMPLLISFNQILDPRVYAKIPADWLVIITDVVNSTHAIESGKYKDVNTAGSIIAMAISNIRHNMDYPFIFGGDGMTFLVPGSFKEEVKDILLDTRRQVNYLFKLELRVGMIKVSRLYEEGFTLGVAKLKVSERYQQAVITGDGVEEAERLIKQKNSPYLIDDHLSIKTKADYSGFSCRWQDIPSLKGETISIILKVIGKGEEQNHLLKEILAYIDQIFGQENDYHPLAVENQSMRVGSERVKTEAMVVSRQKRGLFYFLQKLNVQLQVLLGDWISKHNIPFSYRGKKINEIKQENILSSDFRKFDGALKMVISCSKEDRQKLNAYLKSLYEQKKIYYGIHISDRALLTCLVHYDSEHEVHFVDAADGGYALAAKMLKAQMKSRQT